MTAEANPPQKRMNSSEPWHTIGSVAASTGIAADTLRIWERRYGCPTPERSSSGHRLYSDAEVHRLRLIAEALTRGERISGVVNAPVEELEALLSDAQALGSDDSQAVERLLQLALGMHGDPLAQELTSAAHRMSPLAFLTRRLEPFLTAVGHHWSDGSLATHHERLVSTVVTDLLIERRLAQRVAPEAPLCLLATLPDERHALGLDMVAWIFAHRGWRVRTLGVELPHHDLISAAVEARAAVVGVGISIATGGARTERAIACLRGGLPERMPLLVGGRGARPARRLRGIECLADLMRLDRWIARSPFTTPADANASLQPGAATIRPSCF